METKLCISPSNKLTYYMKWTIFLSNQYLTPRYSQTNIIEIIIQILLKSIFYIFICVTQASTNPKKDSSRSLYGGPLSLTSKSYVRPRGQTMTEQVKESQMTLSFPLNSKWKMSRMLSIHLFLNNKIFELFLFLFIKR